MKLPKNILTVFILLANVVSCKQTRTASLKTDTYKALAELISYEDGDKIHFAKFKIIKDLSDNLIFSDTVTVGYYNYKRPPDNISKVVLTLKKHEGQTPKKNLYMCPDYDGTTNIQKAKIELIDFDYWEGCETGEGECTPLTFSRTKSQKNWFLIFPCGGTATSISISGKAFSKDLHVKNDNCPPYLDLSNLPDGKYSACMTSCGLGGTVKFNLVTE